MKDIKDDPNIKNELENAIQAIKNGEFNAKYLAYPKMNSLQNRFLFM